MQFCYCGECPEDVPRAEDFEFLCYKCSGAKPGWDDAQIITLNHCSKCNRMTFVEVKHGSR